MREKKKGLDNWGSHSRRPDCFTPISKRLFYMLSTLLVLLLLSPCLCATFTLTAVVHIPLLRSRNQIAVVLHNGYTGKGIPLSFCLQS